ncbi:nitroreductase family protein [Paraclostridium sordellii]|nr:nitroreductase family protein [Paeniclostridium sordellii]CEQ27175.1 nitroreductase [[Clostridium] sordellii] [Paeniclostridium sordellii]
MNKLDFIYNRVSVRKYKNEAIPKEDIVEILKAGTYAPSGKNLQNWHFIVVSDVEKIKRISECVINKGNELIKEVNDDKAKATFLKMLPYYTVFKSAPVLILVYASEYPNTEYNILKLANKSDEYLQKALFSNPGIQNIGAAMENILLASSAMGYGTCWMTGPNFARNEIKELIGFEKEGF